MNEEEAKKKWCPHVRIEEETGSFNRVWGKLKKWFPLADGKVDQDNICNCIASDCMMWRWNIKLKLPEGEFQRKERMEAGGYCGLAGK